MEQTRVGVIGLGRMGQQHCRVYTALPKAELVGGFDVDPEVGAAVCARYDVPHFDAMEALLDEVDAVSIVTPTPVHFDLAMECLGRGLHVLVEKPLADTAEKAETLQRAAKTRSQIVMVGHLERFNPAYVELKSVLEGRSVLAITMRRLSAYFSSNRDIDVVFDLMVHDIDLALDLAGQEPETINAYGLSAHEGAIDHAVTIFGFAGGPLVTLIASRVTEQKIRSLEVTALDAYLEADLLNKSISVHRRTTAEYLNQDKLGIKYRQESILEGIHVPNQEPLFAELQHFVDCTLDGAVPDVDVSDGLRAVRIATSIRESIMGHLLGVARYGRLHPDDVRPVMVPLTND
ncbi:MAG: Gfo/Idh/MocA family oxidoreductase [Anaerolineales bacterium]